MISIVKNTVPEFPDLTRWQEVYRRLFGKAVNFEELRVPRKPLAGSGFRLIVVAKEIQKWTRGKPHTGTMKALSKHFPCEFGFAREKPDKHIQSVRNPLDGSYALWVRDDLEADPEFINLSARDLWRHKRRFITVLERMLLEADQFFEKGIHLDLDTVTGCAGSRFEEDTAVCCDWCGDRVLFWLSSSQKGNEQRSSRQVWT